MQKAALRMTVCPHKSLAWFIHLAMSSHFTLLQRTRGRQLYRSSYVVDASAAEERCCLPDPQSTSQPQTRCETAKFSIASLLFETTETGRLAKIREKLVGNLD